MVLTANDEPVVGEVIFTVGAPGGVTVTVIAALVTRLPPLSMATAVNKYVPVATGVQLIV